MAISLAFGEMSFACVFGNFPKWFHVLGQSAAVPADQLMSSSARKYFQRVHSNALNYVPVAVLLIITTIVTIVVCIYSSTWDKLTYTLSSGFSQVIIVQNAIILTVDSFTILIAVGQAVFLSPHFAHLFAQINVIEHLSRKKITWDLFGLRRFLIRRMFYVCAGYSLPYISILLTKPATASNLILLGGDFQLKTLTLVSYFQVLFYIELFNHMLRSFVKYIEARATTATTTSVMTVSNHDSHDKSLQLEMYFFKLVHFNLWEFAQTINYLFGWILVVFVLHHFVFIVFIFFHTCVVLLNPSNSKEMIRTSYAFWFCASMRVSFSDILSFRICRVDFKLCEYNHFHDNFDFCLPSVHHSGSS